MNGQHADGGWNGARVVLIVCCVLAVLLAGVLVGAFSSGGLAGSPVDTILPGEQVYDEYIGDTEDGVDSFGERRGGFGALNPGNGTGVGGEVGFDAETFGANDTEIHFVVESSQPAYWRTGTYDTYTGSGWERNTDAEPYEEPIEHDGIRGEQVSYEVTLNRSATSLPTVWRPASITGVDDLEVADDGTVRPGETLAPGTTFSGVSHVPERDVDILRAAGTSYPDEIRERYTQLPSDMPDRVGEFTDELTADADNPYEAAKEIQDWLRAEKGYSLAASTDSPHVADTFIFEMEAGYCEFFATAMTAMLRTQDVPARYVVGYSTGQSVGDGIYEVRGMNAHAWVEVYFPDVGWVKFDPTPGDQRLATQQGLLEEAEPDGEFEFGEEGSPGERFEPGEIDDLLPPAEQFPPAEPQPPANDTGENATIGYDISLNRTAVPGATVEVTVTYRAEPVQGMAVAFNGEEVGITGRNGTVTGTVPFTEELRIAIGWPEGNQPEETESVDRLTSVLDARTDESDVTTSTREEAAVPTSGETMSSLSGGAASQLIGGGFATPSTTQVAIPPPTQFATSSASQIATPTPTQFATVSTGDGPEEEVVYEVETDATVTVSGDVLPGNEVTVTVLVAGVPVENADVHVAGDFQGRTNENGRATVTLPEASGEQTITVEREVVSGEETVVIPELEVTVESDAPIALPFTSATVEASYGNTSAVGAPVELDGEQVATTGSNGQATVQLPLSSSATVTVVDRGVSDVATVENLFRNLLLVLAVVGFVVGGLAYVVVRQERTIRGTAVRLFGALRGTVAGVRWLLVTLATQGDVVLERVLARLQTTVEYGIAILTGRTTLSELRTAFLAWLTARRAETLLDEEDHSDAAGHWEGPEAYVTVREAWGRFLDNVSVTEETTQTPGELATHAIERDGLPSDAVVTLRDTFREVEYGGRSASDRLERVQQAIDDIERTLDERDERHAGGAD